MPKEIELEKTYKAVRIIITNDQGKILILKRNPNDIHYPGLWDVPGGGVDDGEELREAAEREAEEECGLEIKIEENYFNDFYHQEKKIHAYGFNADLIGGEVLLSNEHAEFKWISKDEWKNFEFIPSVTATLTAFSRSNEIGQINNYAFAFLGEIVEIKMDRMLGSKHPKHEFVYEVNYGFVPGTKAPDGEEVDAYLLGIDKPVESFTGKCVAVIHRKDDKDDKLVVVPENMEAMTDEEILKAVNFQEKWFDSVVIRNE
ncbi:MAG: NUDIX domain-containing protein [Candidatus Staskawiczbacteria bacterium]